MRLAGVPLAFVDGGAAAQSFDGAVSCMFGASTFRPKLWTLELCHHRRFYLNSL